MIEKAFLDSYKLITNNNKDIVDEFMKRIEDMLKDSSAIKQIDKIKKEINSLGTKKNNLVDMRLESIIDKDTYESKFIELSKKIEELASNRKDLENEAINEKNLKDRLKELKKTIESNEVLQKFDRYVFESIIEKVIVGGYEEDGTPNPYKVTFVYKTGFNNSLDITEQKNSKKKKTKNQDNNPCSYSDTDISRMLRHIYKKQQTEND